MSVNNLPFVSVIIPVYNFEKYIAKCIDPLLNQEYPKESFEIIVVDNGSTDATPEIVQRYEKVRLLYEREVQSSYAARNTGIKKAKGQVIALIDADCIPEKQWISEGVKTLLESGTDLVGGPVKFFYGKMTAAELVDSYSHFNNESLIGKKRAALSGNLFVHKRVFEEYGLFPQDSKSGADYRFSNGVLKAGYTIGFSDNAIVWHPTRTFWSLIKKVHRTGIGMPKAIIQNGERISIWISFRRFCKDLLIPKKPFYYREWAKRQDLKLSSVKLLRMDFVLWATTVSHKLGILIETFRLKKRGEI
ncbi:glycosyltransferase [bacterium]|nr:glycosyltransferase [bacterium]